MYRLRYITATGVHYTPWHHNADALLSWVTFLNQFSAIPHFLECEEACPPPA